MYGRVLVIPIFGGILKAPHRNKGPKRLLAYEKLL